MPEWLTERGIGETRHALVEDGDIVETRIELDGLRRAGTVIIARLVTAAARNAVARDENGTEYLLPRGASGTTEGALLNLAITREAIPGAEPWKRPLARTTDDAVRDAQPLASRAAGRDELSSAGWDDVVEQARSGLVSFAGGELRISPTPAMTLIDVDGRLAPNELAQLGAAEAAKAIRRLDLGGSIGIDLPTASGKAARQHAAAAIDAVLPQPFERTAVNGFGFVQIVRPRHRASLVELAQDRAAFEARHLLRRAALEPAGAKRLVAHPAIIAQLDDRSEWLEALSRQVGGAVGLRADPGLPMSGGYAENA
ncbi:MAG: ribonuclease [Sphingomicrobium sp.]